MTVKRPVFLHYVVPVTVEVQGGNVVSVRVADGLVERPDEPDDWGASKKQIAAALKVAEANDWPQWSFG